MSDVLAFLSPTLAREEGAHRPISRSAAEPLFREAGATFEQRDGWQVAASIPDESSRLAAVGIADLSHLGTLDVSPAPADIAGAVVYRLSPRRALVFFPESARSKVTAALGDAHVLDVTAAYTVLGISGPEARALVARLTHLHHFPSGGEVAHITAHVLPAGDGFRIVVAQELGFYLCEVSLDCARALGGGLVGVDALPTGERP